MYIYIYLYHSHIYNYSYINTIHLIIIISIHYLHCISLHYSLIFSCHNDRLWHRDGHLISASVAYNRQHWKDCEYAALSCWESQWDWLGPDRPPPREPSNWSCSGPETIQSLCNQTRRLRAPQISWHIKHTSGNKDNLKQPKQCLDQPAGAWDRTNVWPKRCNFADHV